VPLVLTRIPPPPPQHTHTHTHTHTPHPVVDTMCAFMPFVVDFWCMVHPSDPMLWCRPIRTPCACVRACVRADASCVLCHSKQICLRQDQR
jgi:hypothetical protein